MPKQNKYLKFKGLEWLNFGTKREVVCNMFEPQIKTFLRNDFAENTTDLLTEMNIFIEYDTNNE
jgi:hypothetical protein